MDLVQYLQDVLGVDYLREAKAASAIKQQNNRAIDWEIELRKQKELYAYQDANSLQRLQHQGKLETTKNIVVPAIIPKIAQEESGNIVTTIAIFITALLGLTIILK